MNGRYVTELPPAGSGNETSSQLATILEPWEPIVVSNRAPLEPGRDGGFHRGSGGLVTSLLTLVRASRATCVAVARTDEERRLATDQANGVQAGERPPMRVRYATPDAEQYHAYYAVIANPMLWFVQHYLWDLGYEPMVDDHLYNAWNNGYVEVNRQLAEVACRTAQASSKPPLILTQDYQLYLVPRHLRERVPQATLQHFIHIPWPAPQYWKILPQSIRDAIVDGLLANDVVGFQTERDVGNFLFTCEANMGLRVDHRERAVLYQGRVIWVRSYPISIDVASNERLAESVGVQREEERLAKWRPRRLIVRVDRTDPSKNILRGFLAYARMLREHRELRGQVVFWAFLQPSRQDIGRYRDYMRAIRESVTEINAELGERNWVPIRLEFGENVQRAFAAYRNFDVLLVNPIYDGMNLVAKEGMLLNRKDGALVLSENAGAHEELGPFAITVNPFDVAVTADSLYEALHLPRIVRRKRQEGAREIIRTNDINRWVARQFEDVRELVRPNQLTVAG
jgi:trehalose 6-phosphate synthase